MRVVRLIDEPDCQSRLSPIEELFFATSPSAKTLRPDERQPFKERWLGRYIAYDIETFFVAITEVSTIAGYLAGCLDNPAHNSRFANIGYCFTPKSRHCGARLSCPLCAKSRLMHCSNQS